MTDLDRIFGPVASSTRCAAAMRDTLEHVVQLAVELAREGREGRKIGTLFVIGHVEAVLEQSQSLLLDPLYGHADDLLDVRLPELPRDGEGARAARRGVRRGQAGNIRLCRALH